MEESRFFAQSAPSVLRALHSRSIGLTAKEAQARLKNVGHNALPEKVLDSHWKILVRQFRNALIYILIIATAISLLLGETADAAVIAFAIIINVIIGFIQEFRAQKALASLKKIVPLTANVLRDHKEEHIEARMLVPGDILFLRPGDHIAADIRILEATDCEVNEASLTGESHPVKKTPEKVLDTTPLAEQTSMVFFGTFITNGSALGVVTATGVATEMGKIAKLLQQTREAETPLQKQLSHFSKRLGVIVLVLALMIFVTGTLLGSAIFDMFALAVALAVAAIPEGLIIAVTAVLAIGMQRILKRHGLVKNLLGAETLGSTTVICTDKTGTLTEGKMKVVELATLDHDWGIEHTKAAEHEILFALRLGVLCNDATVANADKPTEHRTFIGNLTDRALLAAGLDMGFHKTDLEKVEPRLATVPFDSTRKWMATMHGLSATQHLVYAKGAPEKIVAMSQFALKGKKHVRLTPELEGQIQQKFLTLSKKGLRLLALAYRKVPAKNADLPTIVEHGTGWVFVGFVGIKDPLRATAAQTIRETQEAGIRTIMITGDHPLTARAIATEIALPVDASAMMEGKDLLRLSEEQLRERVRNVSVFARVTPEDKLRIVDALQANGEVVAMTGDGVNDSPALKAADIGVALGSGTEVAKDAADLVLLDDRFETIVAAVKQGRVIFDNIRKIILYLLSDSFSEIFLITASLLLGIPLPLTAAQILWINLVTDGFPNVALTAEPEEPDIMRIRPRGKRLGILNNEMKFFITMISLLTGAVNLAVFWIVYRATDNMILAQSVTFAASGIDSLIYVFAIRSTRRSIFDMNFFSNRYLLLAVFGGFLLQMAPIYWPFLSQFLGVVALGWFEWSLAFAAALLALILIELSKSIFIYVQKRA